MTTAGCHRIDHLACCDEVIGEVARFVDVARTLDPVARVPSCPDWSAAELMEHIGTVHRWAGNQVKVLTPKRIPSAEMDLGIPAEPADLPEWVAEGGRFVVSTLRDADPDAEMWAWGADQHARFWSRRMLHETAVHRADAELTAGIEPHIPPSIAVDGVDEFLENLASAARFAPRVEELRGRGARLAFRASDADVAWTVRLEPDRFTWDHDDGDGAVTVQGNSSDLVLGIYGRFDLADESRFKVGGDRELLAFWRERSTL